MCLERSAFNLNIGGAVRGAPSYCGFATSIKKLAAGFNGLSELERRSHVVVRCFSGLVATAAARAANHSRKPLVSQTSAHGPLSEAY